MSGMSTTAALSEISQLTLDNKENVSKGVTDLKNKVSAAVAPIKKIPASDLKKTESEEPLLKENPHRFVILPIQVWSGGTSVKDD